VTKMRWMAVGAFGLIGLIGAGYSFAADKKAQLDKAAIEEIVKEYIMNNPEILLQSVENFQKKQELQMEQRGVDAIKDNADWLYKNPMHA